MNSVTEPLISVVIPTYNRSHLIGKTIDSVLKQDFANFEILIVDDGSTDNTDEVVNAYKDARIRYLKKNNAERGAARNYGAMKARGRYINFFDSDDLMYPNHLQEAEKLVGEAVNPEFFHLAYDYKLPDGSVIARVNDFNKETRKQLLFNNVLSCNGVFLRRDIALKFPFSEERQLASSEDWELWIRLVCRFKLHLSNVITSSVVNHDQRSLFTIVAGKVIVRDMLLISKLQNDKEVMDVFGTSFKRYIAERYTFFMLCLSEQKNRVDVWKWGIRALRIYPLILMSRRFLASIKNSLIR